MNTQNIETIEGAKPCLIDEQQANERIEANTQYMKETCYGRNRKESNLARPHRH